MPDLQDAGVTAEAFDALGDTSGYELVDGVIQEKAVSEISGWVGGLIFSLLFEYARQNGGRAYPDGTDFRCFPNPRQTRKPDVSYIRAERLQPLQTGPCRTAPDLAVKVISPNDNVVDLDNKLRDYRAANVSLVWIVNPFSRTVRVIDAASGTGETLDESAALDGRDVLPGFTLPVARLFADLEDAEA